MGRRKGGSAGGYFASYYAAHKEEISEKRKQKYESDPEFRERLKARSAERNKEKSAMRPDGPRHARGFNKPKLVPINGETVVVRGISEFAEAIGRDVYTIKTWERDGIIPPPTHVDPLKRRWYSDAHIGAIASAIREFDNKGARGRDVLKAIVLKKWKN